MVARKSVCLRRLCGGRRAGQVRFGRFLANPRVTVQRVIESWSEQTRFAAADWHVLAIQDTSEIRFSTTDDTPRGLGKIKKGNVRGALLHAMLGVDADSGICLGLVGGRVWTRTDEVKPPHGQRPLSDKESQRWVTTAHHAQEVLAQARMVTFVGDRESDFYALWAHVPSENVHVLTRAMHDHALLDGETLYRTVERVAFADRVTIELRQRANRRARKAKLAMRFGTITLKRPIRTPERDLPESLTVNFIEVIESEAPDGVEPLHWLLLTTHAVTSAADAWQIVAWYKQRWIIEQFFREMKTQGLKIEDSQLQTADRLTKLVAIAAKAAAIIIQLVQARDGRQAQSAELAFAADEVETLKALNKRLEGKTALQKNPHKERSLAWAAWIIAKLGGWDGYPSSKPPGPITFHHGLTYFRAFAEGWAYRNVCIP